MLEVLVVVVIVGVMATAFLMSLGGGRQDVGKEEAKRFAALVRLAGQEAMLRSRDMAVEILPQGYRFFIHKEQTWQALNDEVLRPRKLPKDMTFDVQLDGSVVLFANDRDGRDDEDEDTDPRDFEQRPRIYLFSTGEMTPFEVILRIEDSTYDYRISGGIGGKLAWSKEQ